MYINIRGIDFTKWVLSTHTIKHFQPVVNSGKKAAPKLGAAKRVILLDLEGVGGTGSDVGGIHTGGGVFAVHIERPVLAVLVIVHGEAVGIDDSFGLIVRREDGTLETIRSGEVSVRGLYGYV